MPHSGDEGLVSRVQGQESLKPIAHRSSLIGLGLCLLACCLQPALAQNLATRLELRFSTALAISNLPLQAGWGLGGHLEARYHLSPLSLNLVLEPGASFSHQVTTHAGLTELYALYREGELDLSLGMERLPLEVARLSLPFSLEPLTPLGSRQGRWGARLSWNPPATRLRLAVLEDAGRALPVLSLRREFEAFELEAHALYHSRPVVGLGGSGTLAGLVVYGETWLLLEPLKTRYALGLSGSLHQGFWTLEGGYASTMPLLPAAHFLAGQWIMPQGEEDTWNLSARLQFVHPWQAQLTTAYTHNHPDYQMTGALSIGLGPQPPTLTFRLDMRVFPQY